jgi:hypothetical protein
MVGASTIKAVYGNKIAPGWIDRYLAKFGYDGQQTSEPDDPDRPNNLWKPVPKDFGAHGRFDSRARRWSLQWWMNTHRLSLALAGLTAVTVATVYDRRRSRKMEPGNELLSRREENKARKAT